MSAGSSGGAPSPVEDQVGPSRAAPPGVDPALHAEALAADARIRELVARIAESEAPTRARLDQLLAMAGDLGRGVDALSRSGELDWFMSVTAVDAVRAMFRLIVGAAHELHAVTRFDLEPDDEAVVDAFLAHFQEFEAEARELEDDEDDEDERERARERARREEAALERETAAARLAPP